MILKELITSNTQTTICLLLFIFYRMKINCLSAAKNCKKDSNIPSVTPEKKKSIIISVNLYAIS